MKKIDELIEIIRRQSIPDRLWDAQDVADYPKLAKSTVQSHILCKPDFPKAIRINGTRRWEPQEIKTWAKSNREAA